ncbi:MAG: dual specificity protein phosphatase family protein [Candidatus Altiarchaeota archaeon]|nr:dual specificity protein phosphatase family protein [Candidatus Altiarchaeota archaeon]
MVNEFRPVDENVFRSGIPDSFKDLEFLKGKGISAIVSLEPMEESMQKKAREMGIRVANIHIDEEVPPTDKEVLRALGFINHNIKKGGKVLIHCEHGKQRSGTLSALYLASRGVEPLRAYWEHGTHMTQRHKNFLLDRGELLRQRHEMRRRK